ncbi:MAG: glycerate kinase [Atopobiaceae bacterium]
MKPCPHVLIASDSYKGSATSPEVNNLLAKGVLRVFPHAHITQLMLADGGEGTVQACAQSRDSVMCHAVIQGPLGNAIDATYVLVDQGRTAVIEVASAVGITLVTTSQEHALHASSYGVGQLIQDALNKGVTKIYVGLGGSVTTDGGTGMARALGARFLDEYGKDVEAGVTGLRHIAHIDLSHLDTRINDVDVIGLTDVENPLCGPCGAALMFGEQKGIPQAMLSEVDTWMSSYSTCLEQTLMRSLSSVPGTGAAGGLGFGLLAYTHAKLTRGIDFLLDALNIDDHLTDCDFVLTGEGRMDAQTALGKVPAGVAAHCKKFNIPAIAIVGSRSEDVGSIYENGIDLIIPAIITPTTLEDCMQKTHQMLPLAAETAARAVAMAHKLQRI